MAQSADDGFDDGGSFDPQFFLPDDLITDADSPGPSRIKGFESTDSYGRQHFESLLAEIGLDGDVNSSTTTPMSPLPSPAYADDSTSLDSFSLFPEQQQHQHQQHHHQQHQQQHHQQQQQHGLGQHGKSLQQIQSDLRASAQTYVPFPAAPSTPTTKVSSFGGVDNGQTGMLDYNNPNSTSSSPTSSPSQPTGFMGDIGMSLDMSRPMSGEGAGLGGLGCSNNTNSFQSFGGGGGPSSQWAIASPSSVASPSQRSVSPSIHAGGQSNTPSSSFGGFLGTGHHPFSGYDNFRVAELEPFGNHLQTQQPPQQQQQPVFDMQILSPSSKDTVHGSPSYYSSSADIGGNYTSSAGMLTSSTRTGFTNTASTGLVNGQRNWKSVVSHSPRGAPPGLSRATVAGDPLVMPHSPILQTKKSLAQQERKIKAPKHQKRSQKNGELHEINDPGQLGSNTSPISHKVHNSAVATAVTGAHAQQPSANVLQGKASSKKEKNARGRVARAARRDASKQTSNNMPTKVIKVLSRADKAPTMSNEIDERRTSLEAEATTNGAPDVSGLTSATRDTREHRSALDQMRQKISTSELDLLQSGGSNPNTLLTSETSTLRGKESVRGGKIQKSSASRAATTRTESVSKQHKQVGVGGGGNKTKGHTNTTPTNKRVNKKKKKHESDISSRRSSSASDDAADSTTTDEDEDVSTDDEDDDEVTASDTKISRVKDYGITDGLKLTKAEALKAAAKIAGEQMVHTPPPPPPPSQVLTAISHFTSMVKSSSHTTVREASALGHTVATAGMEVHKSALRVMSTDHNIAMCYACTYLFPTIVATFLPWAPPWGAVCLWYAFLAQLLCCDSSWRAEFFRLVLPLSFIIHGGLRRVTVLDLSGSELLIVGFVLSTLRTCKISASAPHVVSFALQVVLASLCPSGQGGEWASVVWQLCVDWAVVMLGLWTLKKDGVAIPMSRGGDIAMLRS